MKNFFTFNYHKYNLWPVYEAIREYYPIGLKKLNLYSEYHGIKNLEKEIVQQIHENGPKYLLWQELETNLKEATNRELIGTTYGQAPSCSGYLILDEIKNGNFLHHKQLHFAISLVGNFYSIYGLEFVQKFETKYTGPHTVLTVIASPVEEYEKDFIHVQKKIKEKFSDYKMIPLTINELVIEGLKVRYLDDEENCVYTALFNDWILDERFNKNIYIQGDKEYGMEEWIREDYNPLEDKNHWVVMPPLGDM